MNEGKSEEENNNINKVKETILNNINEEQLNVMLSE